MRRSYKHGLPAVVLLALVIVTSGTAALLAFYIWRLRLYSKSRVKLLVLVAVCEWFLAVYAVAVLWLVVTPSMGVLYVAILICGNNVFWLPLHLVALRRVWNSAWRARDRRKDYQFARKKNALGAGATGDSARPSGAASEISVPSMSLDPVATLSPLQFEEYWGELAETGSFSCFVSGIPSIDILTSHLSSRSIFIIAHTPEAEFTQTGVRRLFCFASVSGSSAGDVILAELSFTHDSAGSTCELSAVFKCSDVANTSPFVEMLELHLVTELVENDALSALTAEDVPYGDGSSTPSAAPVPR